MFQFSYTLCMNDTNLELNTKTSSSLNDGKYVSIHSTKAVPVIILKINGMASSLLKGVISFYITIIFSYKRPIADYSRISKILEKEAFLSCLACRGANFMLPCFLKEYLLSACSTYPQNYKQHLDSDIQPLWMVFRNYHVPPKIICLCTNIMRKWHWWVGLQDFWQASPLTWRNVAPKVAWEIIKLPILHN